MGRAQNLVLVYPAIYYLPRNRILHRFVIDVDIVSGESSKCNDTVLHRSCM